MNKDKLIEELKKKKVEIIAEAKDNKEKTSENSELETENFSTSKKNNNWRKRKNRNRNRKQEIKLDEVLDLKKEEVRTEAKNDFEEYKENFLKEEAARDFKEFIELHEGRGDSVFSFDFFVKKKMKEPKIKTVVIDPSMDDISRGVGSKFYLVKPMYNSEYVQFIKDHGPREQFPEQFLTRMFETSILFPENLTKEEIEKMPTGTVLSIYRVILDISDFNKKYRIIEV